MNLLLSYFVVWLLCLVPVLGIWCIVFLTPFVRHVLWYFSAHGNRHPTDLIPAWTPEDFQSYLRSQDGILWSFLSKVWYCVGCQAFHVAWVSSVAYVILAPTALTLFPVVVLWNIPFVYAAIKGISKL